MQCTRIAENFRPSEIETWWKQRHLAVCLCFRPLLFFRPLLLLLFLLLTVIMVGANLSVVVSSYDDHTKAHHHFTHAQLTFFISCFIAALMWVLRLPKYLGRISPDCLPHDVEKGKASEKAEALAPLKSNGAVNGGDGSGVTGNDATKTVVVKPAPTVPPSPTVDEALKDVVLFGAVMFYFFLCDYVKPFPEEPRIYNRDLFLFLIFLLFAVACAFTIKPTQDKILNRDQTEEWKGWMQVMFVWYHYFAAKEWYNWIRVYIACYVWMTGFGNFSFFWVKGDFSLWRVLKMLFRMNFLVIAVLIVTDNDYMLYYICAMHTYWFLTVYTFMRVLSSWNTHRWKMAAKFAAYILFNALIFEIPGMCSLLFRPLSFIFGFHDGKHDIMHEWEFRAGLDHWACLVGMLCAYNYPHFEAFVKHLESGPDNVWSYKLWVKLGMVGGAAGVGVGWYFLFMQAEKFAYNATHCYTAMLPILVFVVLRNAFPVLRRYHCGLFASLGKITLETYLSQLHVYLQSNAKHLIGYLPGYPLLTFALATIIYLTLSHMLFNLTLSFSAFFVQKEWRKGARMAGVGACVVALSFGISVLGKMNGL